MFESAPICTETVSPLWAMIFGAGDACIDLGLWSILPVLAVFIAGVMALQWIANRLLFGGKRDAPKGRQDPGFRPKTGQVVARHLRRPGTE